MHVLGICIAVVCLNILCDKGHPQQSSQARFRTFSCRWVTFTGMADLLYLVQLMKQELPETLCDLG